MKSITLCADDFGYNDEVSTSIIELINKQRLCATSCMTNMPGWTKHAKQLKSLNNSADIGLHFNLTEGNALSSNGQQCFAPLLQLIKQAFSKKLNLGLIAEELKAQLDAFKTQLGRLPDFIDGHQHIHHLPVIREALLQVYQQTFPEKSAYIRIASNPFNSAVMQSLRCKKIIIITLTGALTLKKQLKRLNIPHNQTFSGIYDLSAEANYAEAFNQFIKEVDNNGLIMCHPANQSHDSIGQARQNEYDFFVSEEFGKLLNEVKLVRFGVL